MSWYSKILLAAVIPLTIAAGPAVARTWQVPAEAPTIAAAIDSAAAGDVIELAPGTYFESGLNLESGLTIRAADPASGATIDAGGAGRIFYGVLADSVSLVGLTLTGGVSTNGGAMRILSCQDFEMRDCTVVGNRTTIAIGGAMHVDGDTSILIENCLFQENVSLLDDGGAIWLECPVAEITGCTFVGNDAFNGAGISCSGENIQITACVFTGNSAGNGAGLDLTGDSVLVTDCIFYGNTATRGGAAGCWYGSTPVFVGCTMVENSVSDKGGAIYCTGGSVASIERSILAFNAGGDVVACVYEGTASLVCSDVYGNVDGDWTGCLADLEGIDGNFSLDPVFCPETDGPSWELSAGSPCLPENSPCGQLVGALGLGCGVTSVPGLAGSQLLTLMGNHPNPFNPSTAIAFELERSARVDLRIYDLSGRLVDVLLRDEVIQPGRQEIIWDGRDQAGRQLPSGTYFYRLETGGQVESRRMTLLK